MNPAAVTTTNPIFPDIQKGIEIVQVKEKTIEEMVIEESRNYGVDERLALDIARCESRLRQFNTDGTVLRGEQNPKDVGVFQINEDYHLQESKSMGFDIYTAQGNIDYAIYLLNKKGSKPWKWSKNCWSAAGELAQK